MITGWRLVKRKFTPGAFDGEGARLYGGRWNHPGTSIVYVSEHLSLAALEQLVHIGPRRDHLDYVYFRVTIPTKVRIEDVTTLPADWREEPPPVSTRDIGREWVNRGATAVLKVPSVLVPGEYNYLLNPAHPDFKRITIAGEESFYFDPRMWPATTSPGSIRKRK